MRDVERYLNPDINKLKENDEGTLIAQIFDVELDPLDCKFHYDSCVYIDTKDLTYIWLSRNNLYKLIELIEEAQSKYDKKYKTKIL